MEKKDLIVIILLLILVSIAFYTLYYYQTQGAKCLMNPVVYGIDKFSEKNGKDIECTCNYGISFNRTATIIKSQESFVDYRVGG